VTWDEVIALVAVAVIDDADVRELARELGLLDELDDGDQDDETDMTGRG
jgi:hypothetical protein